MKFICECDFCHKEFELEILFNAGILDPENVDLGTKPICFTCAVLYVLKNNKGDK